MHFADALTAQSASISPVCVGLDPDPSRLPSSLPQNAEGVSTFCRGIIDAVQDVACCVKPQLAYFELLGWQGMKVFWETCAYAKSKRLIVIADGKRGDIGSTAGAYADAYLGKESPIDALTVSPYLGSDSLEPFFERCRRHDKGIFVLVKTSNAGSGELQDLPVGDKVVHEHLAELVESWGASMLGPSSHLSCIGAVIGATYPEEMAYLRSLMPNVPFLIPGYGAQGGTAADVRRGFLPSGTGAVVSASRSILSASSGKDWQEAARKATEKMAREIREELKGKPSNA